MRDEFRADLAEVSRTLVTMAEGVRIALRRATSALLTATFLSPANAFACATALSTPSVTNVNGDPSLTHSCGTL